MTCYTEAIKTLVLQDSSLYQHLYFYDNLQNSIKSIIGAKIRNNYVDPEFETFQKEVFLDINPLI